MTHYQLLKYASAGINAYIEKEQKFVDEGKSRVISQKRLKRLWKDFKIVGEMEYAEECEDIGESIELECPKCGNENEESEINTLHYDCTNCPTSYDMSVCDSCEATIGYYFGDNGICPKCGEQHTIKEEHANTGE